MKMEICAVPWNGVANFKFFSYRIENKRIDEMKGKNGVEQKQKAIGERMRVKFGE